MSMNDALRAARLRGTAPPTPPPDDDAEPSTTGSADGGARSGIQKRPRSMSEHLRAAIRHHRRVADVDYWPTDADA